VTSDNRHTLRKRILGQRDILSRQERHENSTIIINNLWGIKSFSSAKNIMLYINFRSEVETMPLIEACRQKNIQITAPLTIVKPPRLIPYPISNPEKDLRPGYCDIPEPDSDRLTPWGPADIDVVLLPGSVFDLHGGRLGYGGGFYDRFLSQEAPQAIRIALAFEMQVVDKVPVQDHDIPVHYLVTEKRIQKIKE
jgi:5-formyltetrahydrofolate cyclo-ligase